MEKVGALDDFFDLGGNSLLATRVVARIRAEVDVGCRCGRCSAARVVAGLAAQIEAADRRRDRRDVRRRGRRAARGGEGTPVMTDVKDRPATPPGQALIAQRLRRRRARARRADHAPPAGRRGAAVVRPGAALVHGPARARRGRVPHRGARCGCAARSTSRRCAARPGRLPPGTSRCACGSRPTADGRPDRGARRRGRGAADRGRRRRRGRRAGIGRRGRRRAVRPRRRAAAAGRCWSGWPADDHVLLLVSTTSSATAGRWTCCCVTCYAAYARTGDAARRCPCSTATSPAGSAGARRRRPRPRHLDWRKTLAGVTPLELPTDRPRPAIQTYRRRTVEFTVDRRAATDGADRRCPRATAAPCT